MSIKTKYNLIILLSGLVSFIGIVYAALHKPEYGGRGGAVGVAISFYVLFAGQNWGRKAQERLTEGTGGRAPDLCRLHVRLKAIEARINIDADGQRIQNIKLMWASVIGTLAWGFGDIPAGWLQGSALLKFFFH